MSDVEGDKPPSLGEGGLGAIVVGWLREYRACGLPDPMICRLLGQSLQEGVVSPDGSLPAEMRAYHEAGHAVLMLALLGYASDHVSIERGGSTGSTGGAKVPAGFFDDGRDLGCDDERAATGWGGVEAVRLSWLKLGRDPDGSAAGFESDCRLLIHLASAHPGDDDFLPRTQGRAEALLRQHWPAVEAVAAALLEHRELTGDEVARICEGAGVTAPGK